MNVWAWVDEKKSELRDAGHHHLADFIGRIAVDTCANRHAAVDTYADEAIQLARDANEPWVELFLRHWRLQSTILHRQQPKKMVREAVSLIEFSNRPENIDCPQSVCAVQDLTACYRAYDGPGYYEERAAVCKETLEKITPRWSCFGCIGAEYVYALYDSGNFVEALNQLDWLDRQIELSGHRSFDPEIELIRALVQMRLGQFEQAERTLKQFPKTTSHVFKLQAVVFKALSSALQNQHQEAFQQLPLGKDVKVKSDLHSYWVEVIWLCTKASKDLLTPSHLQQCAQFLELAEDRGAYRQALLMGAMVNRLALISPMNKAIANDALETMKRVRPMLKSDLGATELIDTISNEMPA